MTRLNPVTLFVYRFEALPADAGGAAAEEQDLFQYNVKEDGTAEILSYFTTVR